MPPADGRAVPPGRVSNEARQFDRETAENGGGDRDEDARLERDAEFATDRSFCSS